jgi:methionyl-tRNA synthetase
MTARRRILVTSALPYANGPIHLGYLLEAIQTDVWIRFQKHRGHECYYVCADDTHGTPIMLKAQAEGVTPQSLIERVNHEHRRDLADMLIDLDNFGSTDSAETRAQCESIYTTLKDAGQIDKRTIRQAYDAKAEMFLPDRYVKGTCPNCGTADQYGDSCEACGATYTPADLKNPISVVSGTVPVERESEHHFFRLSRFANDLAEWVQSGAVQESVARKLNEWFSQGLKDWDISRDSPYFGFEIPGAPGKYFYVWFDAPIGYLGSFVQLCARSSADATAGVHLKFDEFFKTGATTELHHFIGKDILYFHTLFWPAVLQAAGMRRPTRVHAHGFVTINGHKMSKSRGTFITARRYLENFAPEYLRYYFAAKLSSGIDDIDMNLDEFAARVNSDIVGKLVNIASRCAGFITNHSGGVLAAALPDIETYAQFATAGESIAAAYEARDTAAAVREIMALADRANQYIDHHKPWLLAKSADNAARVQGICSLGLNLFRALMIYLRPVLPEMAAKSMRFFQEAAWSWDSAAKPLVGTRIAPYEPLATRLDPKAVHRLVEVVGAAELPAPAVADPVAAISPLVSIGDFARIDLRVAKIQRAEVIDGADKLLRLQIDVGELGTRQILAGIRAAYDPETLIGRLIVVVANLEPRKMRFGVSEGMMLAAGPGGKDLFLLSPDSGASPGMRIK